MKRSAGFQVALAATLTFLLGTAPALAVTKPLVQFKFKDCGTSSNCLLNLPSVPAGVHWEVRQIACADNLKPTTVKLLSVYLVILQETGLNEIKAAYPKLAFTDNPWGRAVIGCSSGGAAALTMGWFRPDLFRRIIAYSGTFVDQQDDDAAEEAKYPLGAWEYHSGMKLIENTPKKPLRIFTHVSENDLRPKDPEETHHNWVMAGERTAAALKAKDYHHRFVFSLGTNHCDRRVFEQTLADTLVWIWRGYEAE